MSVAGIKFSDMKRTQIGLALSGFSIFAILILRFIRVPFMDPNGDASSIASFVAMGLVFLFLIKRFKLPSLNYFARPRFSPVSIFAILIAGTTAYSSITNGDNELKPWKVAVPGILFLLSIGFGEEIVSRGFIYGVLKVRSNKAAIFISSLFFGLMHLNLYLGSNWDPWLAYWHVASAFCFGVFICAVMIATRSIWVAMLFHALFDWNIVFDKTPPSLNDLDPVSSPFWEGIASPFGDILFLLLPGLLILFFCRKPRIWAPRWVKRLITALAVRWKLVEESTDNPTLVGQY